MKSDILSKYASTGVASSKGFSGLAVEEKDEDEAQPELIEFEDIDLQVIEQDQFYSISPSSIRDPAKERQKAKINDFLQKAQGKYTAKNHKLNSVFQRDSIKADDLNNTELLKLELHKIEHETLAHREVQKFMMAFALHPERAVQQHINKRLLQDDPKSIAEFLVQKEAINKDSLGEYFGMDNKQVLEVLRHYCRSLNFRDLEFDKAIRLLLSKFKIPGQAQKIERIVEVFAEVYFESHSESFKDAGQIHILSYAVIMLNSDAHNPSQHNKMTMAEFVKNTSPVCPGIPKKYLEAMYDRVVSDKFQTETNYIEKIYNRLHMLNVNVTVSGVSKILNSVMELMEGHLFIKFCAGKVKSVQRKVYLSPDEKEIRWVDANNSFQKYRYIRVSDIIDLTLGCTSQVMKMNKIPQQFDSMCFSIITRKRSLDLKARDSKVRAKWVNYIGALLIQNRQTRRRKEESEFQLHFSKDKIEDKWNTEIFTNWDEHWDYKLKQPKVRKYEIVHNVLKGFCCGSTNQKVYEIQKDPTFFSLNGPLLNTLWKFGLPQSSRKTLWPIVIGNSLGLTPSLYQIYRKKKRQIPEIQKLPYTQQAVELVEILAVIRPDISLIRNLLEVAEVFTRFENKYDAFCSFTNTMHGYHFLPFFQGDLVEIEFRIMFFEYLMNKNLPFVHAHFKSLEVNTKIYFINWFLSVFSQCFSGPFLARIWDNFLLQGQLYLFKVGITLVKYYQIELKMSTFDQVLKLLTKPKDTSQVLFFKMLDDEVSVTHQEYDQYIEKRKHAMIKTRVQQIPLH